MIDYARVAEELREYADDPVSVPDKRGTLRAAAELCEAHAAPVDEAKERAEFEAFQRDELAECGVGDHLDKKENGSYARWFIDDEWIAWLARARSDARAKVAEAECDNVKEFAVRLWAVWKEHCAEGLLAPLESYQTLICMAVDAGVEPPPPTIEGEQS